MDVSHLADTQDSAAVQYLGVVVIILSVSLYKAVLIFLFSYGNTKIA